MIKFNTIPTQLIKLNTVFINRYAAAVFVFLIPFYRQMSSIFLIVWIVLFLIDIIYRSRTSHFPYKKPKVNLVAISLVVFFLAYVVSILFSSHWDFKLIEKKLPFIIIPLIASTSYPKPQQIVYSLIAGCSLALVTCLIISTYKSLSLDATGFVFNPNVTSSPQSDFFDSAIYGGNYFFGEDLSIFIHPSYFSMYLVTGLLWIAFIPLGKKGLKLLASIILGAFFCVAIFLLSSKANLIALLIIGPFVLITLFRKKKKVMISLGLVIIAFALSISQNPRFKLGYERLVKQGLKIDLENPYSYNTRLMVWDASLSIIKDNPIFGVGAGDKKEVMQEELKSKNYEVPYQRKYNSHNQFLEFWISMGLIGLLLFIGVLSLALISSIKQKNFLMILFISVFILNNLFESTLNRYYGITYFCIFITLLSSINKDDLNIHYKNP